MKSIKVLLSVLFLSVSSLASAVTVDVFYSPVCPHCHDARRFLDETLKKEYPNVLFVERNVFEPSQGDLMRKRAAELGVPRLGVPLFIVGDDYVSGFGSETFSGQEYRDVLDEALGIKKKVAIDSEKGSKTIHAGWFGDVDLMSTSVPVLAVILGVVDGFNPCAMWVLVFMIGMILEIKNRKKVWTIVGTFLMASGILYFLFMTIWFNAFQLMGQIVWIQRLLGLGALYVGFVSLRDYWKGHTECKVVDSKTKKKTTDKIKHIIEAPMNFALFVSIVGLAFTVNAVEFACSMALPAVFTGVLAQAHLSPLAYYGYIGLYDLFFMLDDIIIFSLAVLAVDKFVGDKYVKYCKLLGGIILILLAVILIVAPEMLR